jgi:uncharacterized protein (DUF305 family)
MAHGHMMQNMPMHGALPAQDLPMMRNMGQATQDYMESMRRTNPSMMAAMMIQDPDLAFLCSMIPHHQGAIDMSRVVLKHGKNPEVRKMAERIIKEQEKEIAELAELVKQHAK